MKNKLTLIISAILCGFYGAMFLDKSQTYEMLKDKTLILYFGVLLIFVLEVIKDFKRNR